MAKKTVKPKQMKAVNKDSDKTELPPGAPKLPPEVEKKLKALKQKIDKFKDQVLDKFGDYIVGITLLPPEKPQEKGKEDKKDKKDDKAKAEEEKINLMIVVDDTSSQKMTKEELHQKFSTIIKKIAEDVDKKMVTQSILLSDIW